MTDTSEYLPHLKAYCMGDFWNHSVAGSNELETIVCNGCGKEYYIAGKDSYYDPDNRVTYKPIYRTVQVLDKYKVVKQ